MIVKKRGGALSQTKPVYMPSETYPVQYAEPFNQKVHRKTRWRGSAGSKDYTQMDTHAVRTMRACSMEKLQSKTAK